MLSLKEKDQFFWWDFDTLGDDPSDLLKANLFRNGKEMRTFLTVPDVDVHLLMKGTIGVYPAWTHAVLSIYYNTDTPALRINIKSH